MAALQHVYLTAHGEWTATPWVGEFAQVGVRVVLSSDTPVPERGSIWTLPTNNGDVVGTYDTVAGSNGTLTQQWSARIGPTGSTVNAGSAVQIDLAEDLRSFLAVAATRMSNGFRWTHIKIAPVLASGKYGAPSSIYQFTTPLVGSGTGNAMPPEVAIATSFRAPVLGRRGRGRMYLPALSADALDASGTVGPVWRNGLSTAAKNLVLALDNWPGIDELAGTLVVMSAGSSTAVIPTQARVGNHADVQRRRKDDVPETYTAVAL